MEAPRVWVQRVSCFAWAGSGQFYTLLPLFPEAECARQPILGQRGVATLGNTRKVASVSRPAFIQRNGGLRSPAHALANEMDRTEGNVPQDVTWISPPFQFADPPDFVDTDDDKRAFMIADANSLTSARHTWNCHTSAGSHGFSLRYCPFWTAA